MKTIQVTVKIWTGLPNHSGYSTEVTTVADERETLNVPNTIRGISEEIEKGWKPQAKKHVSTEIGIVDNGTPKPKPKPKPEPKDLPVDDAVKDILG